MKRQTRIITLLVIDTLFFFVEIIIGYMVHSLALVADSFHMLNDVMSLIVAIYAIKLAAKQTSSPKYSYGWQRAEILGALINGVFLLALCLSIFLEAVQRFFEPQVISQPVLILVVGSAGLASNIVGLVLFHDHGHGGHSHGSGESNGHSHSHTSDIESGENSHANTRPTSSSSQEVIPGEDGSIGEILPESVVRRASLHNARPRTNTIDRSPSKMKAKRTSRQSFASADDIYVSPAANRQFILNQAQEIQSGYAEESDSGEDGYNGDTIIPTSAPAHNHRRSASIPHDHHNHAKPKQHGEGGGHSHQNLNMRGVFLHVLGDALGNIGVIATALFIWLTDFSWRFYSDPVISLVITAIIFSSALPLVKSASLILLQGVPRGISLDDVKEDILQIEGVDNVHELHIWQLSDVKMIASVHIQVNLPQANRTKRYHSIARAIRTCLHAYGIHSSTIQPEFADDLPVPPGKIASNDGNDEDAPLLQDGGKGCLFECVGGGDCEDGRCCDGSDGKSNPGNAYGSAGSSHSH